MTTSNDTLAVNQTLLGSSPLTTTPAGETGDCLGRVFENAYLCYSFKGSYIASLIAVVYLQSMIIFGVAKCLSSHGIRRIFDIRTEGVSFPQRPEFFVLLCSTLPMTYTVLARPLFDINSINYKIFLSGWGLAQTRLFFDLFTRTATIYHLVYWTYRTPIIRLLWWIKSAWKDRPKFNVKPIHLVKSKRKISASPLAGKKQQPARHKKPAGQASRGRTTEHGYGAKKHKHRTHSFKGSTGHPLSKSPSSTLSQSMVTPDGVITPQSVDVTSSNTSPTPTTPSPTMTLSPTMIKPQTIITAQPTMLTGFPNVGGGVQMSPIGNINYNFMMGVNGPQAGGYPINFDTYMPVNYSSLHPAMATGSMSTLPPDSSGLMASTNLPVSTSHHSLAQPVHPRRIDQIKSLFKVKHQITPPDRSFIIACKRAIPGCIYLVSFFITLPALFVFEKDESATTTSLFTSVHCVDRCLKYFYYDLIVLIILPCVAMTAAFYHGALSKHQLNGGSKMPYRMRCYYVTFIILNIPLFVLMITWLLLPSVRDNFSNGVLIAMTTYHSNFVLKSTVYTTGCNCICCTDPCLVRWPRLQRCLVFFTTPVASKDRKSTLEGTVIQVNMETKQEKSS